MKLPGKQIQASHDLAQNNILTYSFDVAVELENDSS